MPSYRYPKQCYIMLKSLDDVGGICWATKIKNLLYKYDFGFVWLSQDVGNINQFIRLFRQKVINSCKNDWHTTAVINSDRCHHCSFLKSLLNVENT